MAEALQDILATELASISATSIKNGGHSQLNEINY